MVNINSRRNFLKNIAINSVGAILAPSLEQLISTKAYATSNTLSPQRELYFGPVIFHWFRSTGRQELDGQWQNANTTLEPRSSWDGSVDFQERHALLAMRSGFNFTFSQVASGFEQEQINYFTAIKNLKDVERRRFVAKRSEVFFPQIDFLKEDPSSLYDLLVAPYFAAESFPCYDCPKDFTNDRVLKRAEGFIFNWFRNFLSVLDAKDLPTINGKVLAGMWYVPGAFNAGSDFFKDLNAKISAEFGFDCYWTAHYSWGNSDPDEINGLFSGVEPLNINDKGNVDLLAGFWPPTENQKDLYLKREGGLKFANSLDEVEFLLKSNKPPRIIVIESMREITEGSDIMPSFGNHTSPDLHYSGPIDYKFCFNNPCHPVWFNDSWSDSLGPEGPFIYLINSRKFSDKHKYKLFGK